MRTQAKQTMSRAIRFFVLHFLLVFTITPEAQSASQAITLAMPEVILAEAVTKCLPAEIDTSSESINGSVFIQSIDNIQLENDTVSAHLVLAGKEVQINTTIAGHTLRLNIGDVQLNFNISALVRFDKPSQTLFITPNVADFSSEDKKGNDLGILLINLLNGKEFPIAVEKLQPIVTDLGTKQLAIELSIDDVIVKKDALLLYLAPDISTSALSAK